MKICMPIENDNGLDSIVNTDFDSTSYYMVCDTQNKDYEIFDDRILSSDGKNILSTIISNGVTHIITKTMKSAAFSVLHKRTNLEILEAVEPFCSGNIALLNKKELPKLTQEKLISPKGCGSDCSSCGQSCTSK